MSVKKSKGGYIDEAIQGTTEYWANQRKRKGTLIDNLKGRRAKADSSQLNDPSVSASSANLLMSSEPATQVMPASLPFSLRRR